MHGVRKTIIYLYGVDMKQVAGIWLPDNDTHFAKALAESPMVDGHGTYQLAKIEKCLAVTERRRVALDIGAHVGVYTWHLSRYFQCVHAFEPAAPNYQCLLENVGHLNNMYTHNVAIGDEPGRLRIHQGDNTKNVRWSALVEGGDYCDVDMITIDSLKLKHVDYIRVDVKGYEPKVIAGAAETIARCRPLVLFDDRFDPDKLTAWILCDLGLRQVWNKRYDRMYK